MQVNYFQLWFKVFLMIDCFCFFVDSEWTLYEQVAVAAMDCQCLDVAQVLIFNLIIVLCFLIGFDVVDFICNSILWIYIFVSVKFFCNSTLFRECISGSSFS